LTRGGPAADAAVPAVVRVGACDSQSRHDGAYKPSLCQVIYTEWVLSEGTFWSGRGALSFTGASALSPYHTLPIIQQLPPIDAD
jgi:hypothetical protein